MSVFDPFSARPRSTCEDCGTGLVYDDAAFFVVAARYDAPTLDALARAAAGGGSLYACPSCGFAGAFSPVIGDKSC